MPLDRRTFLQTSLAASALAGALTSDRSSNAADDPERPFNPTIQRARDVALQLLNPTDAELQHGLELHRDSLVFDAYGFSPRAAIDGDALAELVNGGASDLEIQDAREDMTMTR
jgi:membrane dipeptidase